MKNKLFASLLLLTFSFTFEPVLPSSFAAPLPITASSAVLLDAQTNKLLYSKTPHLRRAPASTTKLLTAIVATEQLDLNQVVTIPSFVKKIEPSKIYLKPGEKYRVRELIRATLINSANDAAETLAHAGGRGSRYRFAQAMNAKIRKIGCQRSNFVNASGLPAKNQYSTAYDMALIMKEFERYPFLVQTLKTRTLIIKSAAGRKIFLKNHNRMLWGDKREVVGKTGWTRLARHCFVGQIGLYGNKKVVVSMLGSHRLWKDLKTLVDFQFGVKFVRAQQNKKVWADKNKTIQIQKALKRAGTYTGPINGRYDAATIKAIRSFQKRKGLRVDGIVGPKTWSRLKSFLP